MSVRDVRALLPCVLIMGLAAAAGGQELAFDRIVIDADFPGGYQVEVADVNGDGRADIVALGGATCVWYENPTWRKRIVTGPDRTPGVITSATADLDGDGRAEIAIGHDFEMNAPGRGKLALAVPWRDSVESWDLLPVGDQPSIHRVRWGDLDGDGRLDLVVAPIFGPGAAPPAYEGDATLRVYHRAPGPEGGSTWQAIDAGAFPVMHAIEVLDVDGDDRADILAATNAGVQLVRMTVPFAAAAEDWRWEVRRLSLGAPGEAPARGSSEVHLGRLKDGRRFLATIDPWHGGEVAVCLEETPRSLKFEPRTVIDDTLDAGHALWVADVDGDGDAEVFAGHRGADARVSVYRYDGLDWNRNVIDRAIAAQDLRGGDLDGDGRPDVVAIGGATGNVVWYRPRSPGT
jgi:hypothetical protein